MRTCSVTPRFSAELTKRNAIAFVQQANEFSSKITVTHENKTVNGKSLLGILSLGFGSGITVTLCAEGADEDTALEALSALLEQLSDK